MRVSRYLTRYKRFPSSNFGAPLQLRYSFDFLTTKMIIGWAFCEDDETPLAIEAWVGEVCVGRTDAANPRLDVMEADPRSPRSGKSGFELTLRLPSDSNEVEVQLRACRQADEKIDSFAMGSVRLVTAGGFRAAREAAAQLSVPQASPFPAPITRALGRLWPDQFGDLDTTIAQTAAVKKIAFLAAANAGNELPFLMDYIRYLRMIWAHFNFVARNFPSVDLNVAPGAKDAGCKPNSIYEMLSIAHHLYVLKSHGVAGQFAEFGCYKGYSSAFLSYACDYLGITMRIYDSFAGLPPSTSTYYKAGDFRGNYEEVRQNVELFGSPQAVIYRKGYFAETLPTENMPPLMCLWMDVDLASSARDVMCVVDEIDPRGCVFSHECQEQQFMNGVSVAQAGPDNVVSVIVKAYSTGENSLTCRHIVRETGAFWRRSSGIPVLDNAALLDLIEKV